MADERSSILSSLRGLPYGEAEEVLRKRVTARFSEGGPERGLEEFLKSLGMETSRVTDAAAPGSPIFGTGHVLSGGLICQTMARVVWRADAEGRITELTYMYGDVNCL